MKSAWLMVGMMWGAMAASAQTAPAYKPPVPAMRTKVVRFSDDKPVLGVPMSAAVTTAACTPSGTAFVDTSGDTGDAMLPGFFRISPEGSALPFKVLQPPKEYEDVGEESTFVNDRAFVTLFRAEKRDTDSGRVLERRFFLSKQPLDGSDGEIVVLDVKFRPLSIALIDTGDYLVIGWDEANLIPELAMVKPNGTVRRFIDLDNRASSGDTVDPFALRGGTKPSAETFKLLQNAHFTPFGVRVVLAAKGGTAPLHIFSNAGEDLVVPLVYPSGMVMHDVLSTGQGPTIMVRFEAKPTDKDGKPEPGARTYQRLFEADALHGYLLTEYTTDTPAINDVSCAPARKIAAIYKAPDPDASKPAPNPDGTPAKVPTRLVVATTSR